MPLPLNVIPLPAVINPATAALPANLIYPLVAVIAPSPIIVRVAVGPMTSAALSAVVNTGVAAVAALTKIPFPVESAESVAPWKMTCWLALMVVAEL